MSQKGIHISVEVDRKTDAILRDWAREAERSKRSLARVVLRRMAAKWNNKRGGQAA